MLLAVALAAVLAVVILAVVAVSVAVLCEGSEPLAGWKPAGWIALGMGVMAGLGLLVEVGSGGGALWETGRLSSGHAALEDTCAACHDTSETVSTARCVACHERVGDPPGRFTLEAHHAYGTGEPTGAVEPEREVGCAACHVEHRGRRTDLRATASDARCESCHAVGGLDRHPEFDFAAHETPDDAGLAFTHVRHIRFVLDERGLADPQAACLACHLPRANARGFRPIAFDTACGACHLTGDDQSPELPVQPRGVPLVRPGRDGVALRLGVETLETVRARLGPGEQWSRRMSPSRFEVDDGLLVAYGVEHADPWVLHNLRRLRRAVHPAAGLADLLTASADVGPADRRRLYDEALGTLRSWTDELRGRDEDGILAAVREFDRMMEALVRRIGAAPAASDLAAYDEAPFRLGEPDPRLTADQIGEVDAFAARVAAPCLECHTVERATIRRVQRTQSALRRARFDHRPHVLLRGCLDCHTRIPVADLLAGDAPIPAALDNAAIQNLPGIETCRQCHAPDLSFDRCRTCHEFHPGASPGVP